MQDRRSGILALASSALLLLVLFQIGCSNPRRTHDDRTITSVAKPTIVLRIDPSFTPLAPLRFPLESLSNVDRRIFVDADDEDAIRRLVIVQFEHVQPGADFRFVYPARPPAQFGSETYRFGAYVHDEEADAARSPTREAGRTRAYLIANGFKVPRVFRLARLARVTDPDGTSEIILSYMEGVDAEFPARPLPGADEDGDVVLDDVAAQALLARLKSVIVAVSG